MSKTSKFCPGIVDALFMDDLSMENFCRRIDSVTIKWCAAKQKQYDEEYLQKQLLVC